MDLPGETPKTRGSHIILPKLTGEHALVIRSGRNNRILFVIPWEGMTLVGTTDVDDSGDPGNIQCPDKDRDYLLNEARRFFPGQKIQAEDVIASFAGIRPLVNSSGGHPSLLSRESKIFKSHSGLISITGGKFTTYRKIAEDMVDRFPKILSRKRLQKKLNLQTSPCVTRSRPLMGGEMKDPESYLREIAPQIQSRFSLETRQIRHLVAAYGTKHSEVLGLARENTSLSEKLHPALPHIKAEVVYAIRKEAALHLSDFLRRRSLIALGMHRHDTELLKGTARLMEEELGWDEAEIQSEIKSYLKQ